VPLQIKFFQKTENFFRGLLEISSRFLKKLKDQTTFKRLEAIIFNFYKTSLNFIYEIVLRQYLEKVLYATAISELRYFLHYNAS
jgi:hypothetical protein